MERRKKAEELYKQLDDHLDALLDDHEFTGIVKDYLYGEVYQHGTLDIRLRQLALIVTNTTNHTLMPLRRQIVAAIKQDVDPYAIREAIYQCTPYIGIGKVRDALVVMYRAFKEYGVGALESTKTVTEETREQAGYAIQCECFTKEGIDAGNAATPDDLKHIRKYLAGYCFGDFYTREGLSLPERELMTMVMLATLGGCESQLRSHVGGNIRVGNTRDMLIETITQIQPYIGFPRTLNALNIINELTLK